MLNSIPRPEHPTPQLMRRHWMNLNGQWQFQYDYGFSGAERGFEKDFPFEHEITVPFCPESSLSVLTGYKGCEVSYEKYCDIGFDRLDRDTDAGCGTGKSGAEGDSTFLRTPDRHAGEAGT